MGALGFLTQYTIGSPATTSSSLRTCALVSWTRLASLPPHHDSMSLSTATCLDATLYFWRGLSLFSGKISRPVATSNLRTIPPRSAASGKLGGRKISKRSGRPSSPIFMELTRGTFGFSGLEAGSDFGGKTSPIVGLWAASFLRAS